MACKFKNQKDNWKYSVRMIYKAKPKATKENLVKLKKEIDRGTSFAKVAKRETEGPGKTEGGHIGSIAASDLQPELGKVLTEMNANDISPVIETKRGFYILQCLEKKLIESSRITAKKNEIREELVKLETARSFDSFIRGLREKSKVKVLL